MKAGTSEPTEKDEVRSSEFQRDSQGAHIRTLSEKRPRRGLQTSTKGVRGQGTEQQEGPGGLHINCALLIGFFSRHCEGVHGEVDDIDGLFRN